MKPADEFNRKRGTVRQSLCRPCQGVYIRKWYAANKAQHLANVRRNARARMAELYRALDALKQAPCADCGGRFSPVAMDFDHVRGVKVKGIASMVGDLHSDESILAEIAKCDVVCACCHRVRTAARRGSRRGDT